ncbi:MAG: hypothetical protein VKN13_01790 [Cyanobacteriota bacterium]|nr:hypothetical protein [Cyanobacteriota bacterium]
MISLHDSPMNVSGRPHGLGNRIEEIIRLEALADRWQTPINYLWMNPQRRRGLRRFLKKPVDVEDRTYPILMRSDRVAIVPAWPDQQAVDFASIPEAQEPFSSEELRHCGARIRAIFSIGFSANTKPIGVHLRGTDRINPHTNHEHFLRSEDEFTELLQATARAVNARSPQTVFLCADAASSREQFRRLLHPGIQLIEPECAAHVPEVYRDFFGLAACSAIYLAGQFSSFSLTAGLIGDRTVHMARISDTVRQRYGTRIEPLDGTPDSIR